MKPGCVERQRGWRLHQLVRVEFVQLRVGSFIRNRDGSLERQIVPEIPIQASQDHGPTNRKGTCSEPAQAHAAPS